MSTDSKAVPDGWLRVSLEEVLAPLADGRTIHHGWSPQCEKSPATSASEWAVLKTTACQDGAFLPEHNKRLPPQLAPRPNLEVAPGDILITVAGPRARCGVACLVRSTRPRLMISGKMLRFRVPDELVEPRYIEAFLRAPETQAAIDGMKTGISDSGLNFTQEPFRQLQVLLAPREQQQRIADALDDHFTRLDAAEAALKRAQARLKRFRASVLQAAVTGRLVPTEAELARREGRSYEPASKLLERVLAERRKRFDASGKRGKYVEPAAPEVASLPEPPEGWCWATVDQIAEIAGGITKNPSRRSLGRQVPYLRVANVYADRLDLTTIDNIGVSESEFARSKLQVGDVLVVEGNGSIEQIGRAAVWSGAVEACTHQNHIIRARPTDGLPPRWLLTWMLSPAGRMYVERVASSTSGLHTLSLTKVGSLPIPIPPSAEAQRILDEADRLTTDSAGVLGTASMGESRVAALRRATLRLAFEGRLVDPDPFDEPASILLDRIRAARAQAASNGPPKSRSAARRPKTTT